MGLGTSIILPFTGGSEWDMGVLYWPFLVVGVLGLVNAVNLTDGLDGLASGVTVLVATYFAAIAWGIQSNVVPIAAAAVGSLLGFLLFNSYPAKVFMGDTGSLALGGFCGCYRFCYENAVVYFNSRIYLCSRKYFGYFTSGIFQKTKKRLFRMAPIHHHFELGGWPETKVVTVFRLLLPLCV